MKGTVSLPTSKRLDQQLRTAYFSSPALGLPSDLKGKGESDNRAVIRKYYPKKVVSALYTIKRLPKYLQSCTKTLKSLQLRYFCPSVKVSCRRLKYLEIIYPDSTSELDASYFRKTLLAAKRLNALRIRGLVREESLKEIVYLRGLQILKIELQDKQLAGICESILALDRLKSISVLFSKMRFDNVNIQDPSKFLRLCENILTKRSLKRFRIGFDSDCGHYSSEVFEKVFSYLEQSHVSQWAIQAFLAEDQVLRIAETYSVFKQASLLAIHKCEIGRFSNEGMKLEYGEILGKKEVQENKERCLDIYLIKSSNKAEEHRFEMESVLQQCLNVVCLFIEWDDSPLCQHASLDDEAKAYQSLRTLYFQTKDCTEEDAWEQLLQVLEKATFLEKFYLILPDIESPSNHNAKGGIFNTVEAYVKKLIKLTALKSFDLNLTVEHQRSMCALQELFMSLPVGLKELSLNLFSFSDSVSLPVILSSNMTELTQLQLYLYCSTEECVKNLIDVMPTLTKLRMLQVISVDSKSIKWALFRSLMGNLRKLNELSKVDLYLQIRFDWHTNDCDTETQVKMLRHEVSKLQAECKKLEFIQVYVDKLGSIQYRKYTQ